MPLKLGIHADLGLTYPNETLAAWTRSPVVFAELLKAQCPPDRPTGAQRRRRRHAPGETVSLEQIDVAAA